MPPKAGPRRAPARAQAVALPRRLPRPPGRLKSLFVRFSPSRRSVAAGFVILAVVLGGYFIARETSLFAVRSLDVRGAPPRLAAQVRQALAPLMGKSLVGLDGSAVLRRVDALPGVVSASYDRSFPDTLSITIVPERPVAVLRSGSRSWLVSARGRVLERLSAHPTAKLPRVWLPSVAAVHLGELLPAASGGVAAHALGAAGRFGARQVSSAALTNGVLVFNLKSGIQLRLGEASAIRMKLAVAERALPALPAGSAYLDVSVPGRPVSGTVATASSNPQVSSRG